MALVVGQKHALQAIDYGVAKILAGEKQAAVVEIFLKDLLRHASIDAAMIAAAVSSAEKGHAERLKKEKLRMLLGSATGLAAIAVGGVVLVACGPALGFAVISAGIYAGAGAIATGAVITVASLSSRVQAMVSWKDQELKLLITDYESKHPDSCLR